MEVVFFCIRAHLCVRVGSVLFQMVNDIISGVSAWGWETSRSAMHRDYGCRVSECVVHAGLCLLGVKMPGIVVPLVYLCCCPDDMLLAALALMPAL